MAFTVAKVLSDKEDIDDIMIVPCISTYCSLSMCDDECTGLGDIDCYARVWDSQPCILRGETWDRGNFENLDALCTQETLPPDDISRCNCSPDDFLTGSRWFLDRLKRC